MILSLQLDRLLLSTVFGASTLWTYDYFQTLPMEVQAIWNRKQTVTSILFLMNRYAMLLYIISYIYANIPETTHFTWSCGFWALFGEFCQIVSTASACVLLTMRVYAIYDQHRWILAISFTLITARLCVDFWGCIVIYRGQPNSPLPTNLDWDGQCTTALSNIHQYIYKQFITIALTTAFDVFVLLMTLIKTLKHVVKMPQLGLPMGISAVIIRDGTMYFLIVFTMAAVYCVLTILSYTLEEEPKEVLTFMEFMSPLVNTLPNILVARLVLNPRVFGDEPSNQVPGESAGPSRLEPGPFPCQAHTESRILGNIGAPLDYGQWDEGHFDCDMPETDGPAGLSGIINRQAVDLEHGARDGGYLEQEIGERSSGESPVRVSDVRQADNRSDFEEYDPHGSIQTIYRVTKACTSVDRTAFSAP